MATIILAGLIASTDDLYDRLIGTSNNDTVSYSLARGFVAVSLDRIGPQDTLGSGVDELVGIENLTGSLYGDFIQGNSGSNILDGSGGEDTISYSNASGPVRVDLSQRISQNTISAGFDTLLNFENLVGSRYSDDLKGTRDSNFISAGSGDDLILATGGYDVLNGGPGHDLVDYSSLVPVKFMAARGLVYKSDSLGGLVVSYDRLTDIEYICGAIGRGDILDFSGAGSIADGGAAVSLATGTVNVSRGSSSAPLQINVLQFEDVIGTSFDDTIIGDDENNYIMGKAGKDTLTGGWGRDVFQFPDLTDSPIGNFDVITDYRWGDIIDRPGNFSSMLTTRSLFQNMSQFVTTAALTNPMTPNSSYAFELFGQQFGTYIAMNDATPGFDPRFDSLVFLQGFSVAPWNPVTVV